MLMSRLCVVPTWDILLNVTAGEEVLARKHMHRVKEVKPAITESGRPRFPLGERRNAIKRLPPTLQVVGPNGVQDITLWN